MWFQDFFNYDFRRTEMCIIPYGTQEGEISFCAYNTGIGWRNILEKMHQNATVSQWYKKHGKHTVYANGKGVPMDNAEHQLNINEEHASRVRVKGDGPQNAHDEEIMRRKMMQNNYWERSCIKFVKIKNRKHRLWAATKSNYPISGRVASAARPKFLVGVLFNSEHAVGIYNICRWTPTN